jgi:hypothetical protein
MQEEKTMLGTKCITPEKTTPRCYMFKEKDKGNRLQ